MGLLVAGIRRRSVPPFVDNPSPNFGPRRGGAHPSLIVLHYTAMTSAQAALDRLSDPGAEVSAHYLICKTGRLYRLVAERDRAWHAGVSGWGTIEDVNSHSIGIELDNDAQSPFAAPLMATLVTLLSDIMRRHRIPPERVISHSDCAPGRKIDPGPHFDWSVLAARGLAAPSDLSVGEGFADATGLDQALSALGYPPAGPEDRLAAFRLRHRPRATGPITGTDTTLAQALAARYPVDPLP